MMRKTTGWMLALALTGTAGMAGMAAAQALDPVEQRIVAEVKAHAPQALDLLRQSVLINSGTMNVQGVREVGNLFRSQFDALGFQTRWLEMPAAMQRAGHLVATREGPQGQGKRLLLLGHLDTVFEPGSAVPLWEQKDGRIRGQGVADMKAGHVIVSAA